MRLASSLIAGVLGLSSLLFVPLALAQDAGVTISPPRFELTVTPGQVVRDKVLIINNGTAPLPLSASVRDFVAGGEGGEPSFVDDPTKVNPSISVSQWITIPDGQNVTVQPGEKREIPFTITVPEGAEPGGKYGAIFFSPPKGEGQVAVQQRVGSLVILRVGGNITEAGTLERFAPYDKDLKEVAEASRSFLYLTRITEDNPVSFAIRYENTGTVHVKPTGQITLSNFGIPLKAVGVKTTLNNQGLEVSKDIVDYIPVNNARGNVLSKSFRTFREEYRGTPYFQVNEQGVKEVKYRGFPVGFYTATLTLDPIGGGTQTVVKTHFIVFPALPILGTLLVLALLIFGFLRYRSYSKRKMEEEFKRRFGVQQ